MTARDNAGLRGQNLLDVFFELPHLEEIDEKFVAVRLLKC